MKTGYLAQFGIIWLILSSGLSARAQPPEQLADNPLGLVTIDDAHEWVETKLATHPEAAAVVTRRIEELSADGWLIATIGEAFRFGEEVVYCVFAVTSEVSSLSANCYDSSGEERELADAWVSMSRDYYEAHGSLTPAMVGKMREAGLREFEATVWLRQPSAEPREFLPLDFRTFQEVDSLRSSRQRVVAEACTDSVGQCRVLGIDKLSGPLITVSATRHGLEALARHPLVGAIEPTVDWEQEPAGNEAYLQASYFDAVQSLAPPWDGAGSKIAIVEGPQITPLSLPAFAGIHDPNTELFCSQSFSGTHADAVGSVVAADSSFNMGTRILDGAAPNTRLYVGNLGAKPNRNCSSEANDPTCDPSCDYNSSMTGVVNWARSNLVDVINNSNHGFDPTIPYLPVDRFFDWVANQHPWPVIVPITGQITSTTVSSHGCGNCIVVGGSNFKGTKDRSDDTIFLREDFANRPSGPEVPHVVAPAQNLIALENGQWELAVGTSFAAPQVSGLAGAIIGQHPDLRSYPEAVRALIMATATRDVDGVPLDLNDGVDDRDGAGAINAFLAAMALITGAKNAWGVDETRGLNFGLMSNGTFAANGYYSRVAQFVAPAGEKFQATLTWNVASTCADAGQSGSSACPVMNAATPLALYSLELRRTTNLQLVALSTTANFSQNYVHLRVDSLVPGERYFLFIRRIWENPTPPNLVYFGLAWHTFSPFFE